MIRKIQVNKPENKVYTFLSLTYRKCTEELTCKRRNASKEQKQLLWLLALCDVDCWVIG